jgi:hypothetical protein
VVEVESIRIMLGSCQQMLNSTANNPQQGSFSGPCYQKLLFEVIKFELIDSFKFVRMALLKLSAPSTHQVIRFNGIISHLGFFAVEEFQIAVWKT